MGKPSAVETAEATIIGRIVAQPRPIFMRTHRDDFCEVTIRVGEEQYAVGAWGEVARRLGSMRPETRVRIKAKLKVHRRKLGPQNQVHVSLEALSLERLCE